jgi:hypothetical protein
MNELPRREQRGIKKTEDEKGRIKYVYSLYGEES